MIEVQELWKTFGEITAVGGISFHVDEGEIFGLLGPNGAGKTTTISVLCGLLNADSGTVRIAGLDIKKQNRQARKILGVIPQEIALYEELSGRDNLRFWGSLYGLSGRELRAAIDRVLDLVDLTERGDDPVREYSGGMKRRINLCAGLIHQPKIVLLDEPTLGIDPQARIKILDIVREEAARGKTIIYTTHYLEEAESLCDRIAIIDKGEIHAIGTLEELTRLVGEETLVTIRGDFTAAQVKPLLGRVNFDHLEEGCLRVKIADRGEIGGFLGRLFPAGINIDTVSIREPNLQSVFLKLTGRELRD
ncbi:MAG: ABC transporter ATP-binding protein [Candidatus Krumholzibacteriota bacterium]|nr:ABC transporter ATP-binding protein [Candidatus Krumholzibacteriota bacterium]